MERWKSYILSLFIRIRIISWCIICSIWRSLIIVWLSLAWAICFSRCLVWQTFYNLSVDIFDLLKSISICIFFIRHFLNAFVNTVFEFVDSVTGFFRESGGCILLGLVDSFSLRWFSSSILMGLSILWWFLVIETIVWSHSSVF
jgi:hypothetical protein